MADHICRALRDGALEGEHAVALTIKDSLHSPFGSNVFDHFLCNLATNISMGRPQARHIVVVAFDRSPKHYLGLLRNRGLAIDSSDTWVSILDCYSDPLGWKERLQNAETYVGSVKKNLHICKNVRDVDNLLSIILALGGATSEGGKAHFAVAIDSVSTLLRHVSLTSVAKLIYNIRCQDKVSSIFWLIHSDLHESMASISLEYLSTMVASLEPKIELMETERTTSESLFCLEKNSLGGKFHVRMKRRNGRVKVLSEQFHMEKGGIKFSTTTVENTTTIQNLFPKLQFNLQLSEKEQADRAKVVLPFEHQGNDRTIKIYDGRRSLSEVGKDIHTLRSTSVDTDSQSNHGKGEIHYIRDSDDEMPDSDEDPDDDLDI